MDIDKIIEEIEAMHPYKVAGKPESYDKYNEGWSDACDILGEKIKEFLSTKKKTTVVFRYCQCKSPELGKSLGRCALCGEYFKPQTSL